jgi:hypothetical protein
MDDVGLMLSEMADESKKGLSIMPGMNRTNEGRQAGEESRNRGGDRFESALGAGRGPRDEIDLELRELSQPKHRR